MYNIDVLEMDQGSFATKETIFGKKFYDDGSIKILTENLKNSEMKIETLRKVVENEQRISKEDDFQDISDLLIRADQGLKKAILVVQRNELIKEEELSLLAMPTEFGLVCLIVASLCPIFLARKVRKLALHTRIIWQVLKRIFALLLVYVNIITLFKNILVYLLYKKDAFKDGGAFNISQFNKIIAMMVGELTYDENFVQEGLVTQLVFLVMVILTTLLNNLLIGLTTSNITELMKKANDETTSAMLRSLKYEYRCKWSFNDKHPNLILKQKGKVILYKRILRVMDIMEAETPYG